MSLVTKISSGFWSDEDVGALSPEQKLAVLWVLTNRDMNNLGYLKISKRQFEFDTGMSIQTLEAAMKGLPRGFLFRNDEAGMRVLSVNFIYYQFSDAVNNPANNVHRHLRVLLEHAESWVRKALEGRYKGLRSPLQKGGEKLAAKLLLGSSSGKSLARDQSRAEQRRAEQSPPEEGVQGGEGTAEAGAGAVAGAARVDGAAVRASQVRYAALRDRLRELEGKGGDRTREECEELRRVRQALAKLQAAQREGRF